MRLLTLTVRHGGHPERERIRGPVQRVQRVGEVCRQERPLAERERVELLLLSWKQTEYNQ